MGEKKSLKKMINVEKNKHHLENVSIVINIKKKKFL